MLVMDSCFPRLFVVDTKVEADSGWEGLFWEVIGQLPGHGVPGNYPPLLPLRASYLTATVPCGLGVRLWKMWDPPGSTRMSPRS